jgi:hypothetical protein
MHKRYKICSWCSANHKGYLRLRWDAHKESGLSQPQTPLNDHKDLVRFSTIKSPRMRGQYKFFEIHHNFCNSLTTPSPSSEQVPKSNEHTEIIGEVLSLKIWEDHSKGWLKSLLRSLDWSEVWRRECLNLRNVGSKVYKWVKCPAEWRTHGAPFIARKKNLSIGMSEIRACPGWGPNMSVNSYWNPVLAPNMSGV